MSNICAFPRRQNRPLETLSLQMEVVLIDLAISQDRITDELQDVIRTLEQASENARLMIDYVDSPSSRADMIRQSAAIDRNLATLRSKAALL